MEEEKGISLSDIFRVIKKNIILICVIVLSMILLGGVYTFGVAKEKYRAETTLMVAVIDDNTARPAGAKDVDFNSTMYLMETVKSLVKQDIVLDEVKKKHEDINLTTEALRSMIDVISTERTMLLNIRVTYTNGEIAVELANEVAEELIRVVDNKHEFRAFKNAISITSSANKYSYDSPNKIMYMMIFALLGVVVACIVVFVMEFASNKYRTKKDVEADIRERVIGTFYYHKQKANKNEANQPKQIDLVHPSIKGFEAYNKLLSNIKYQNIDNPVKVIASVSTNPNELKSTISCNLAYCMAHNNKKVCLVDLDLRKPVVHQAFGVSKENGLIDYLEGTITKEELIKHSSAGVDIITAGHKVINPIAVLESNKLHELVAELRNEYDYVVIDSAPLLACADSLTVAKMCDGVMFNVALRTSKKSEIKEALNSLKSVGVKQIGVNVTKIPMEKNQESYYYGE